jgi:invasion protein IalB
MLVDNSVVDQLAHAGDSAMVKIKADDGKNYDLKLSLNGFSAAHDSMTELAKQKAKAPAAPAAPAAPGK